MIVSILLYILAGLVAGIAGAVAVLIFADVMFRICGSSLFEILDEIERLEEENKKYEDDDN
jgi:hypothetical protein|nr:MAG TPA: Ribosome associated membrane protein RAMP4 [Caudoviricetes sp.]